MKVSVIGFGTVGKGVYEMLKNAPGLETGKVLVLPEFLSQPDQVTDFDEILSDASVDAVAEAIGGVEFPYQCVKAALEHKKHVVTSNKALIAEKGIELSRIAREMGVGLLFSAACGGGVPILHNMALAAKTDKILCCGGILNGTTNFILDRMTRFHADYAQTLREAQSLGYAEQDPSADVSGLDTLRKIMLCSGVAFGLLPHEGLCREGIEQICASDIEFFAEKGFICRLKGKAGKTEKGCYAYVEPTLLSPSSPDAAVLSNNNLAFYEAEKAGSITLIGQGAGRYPTASAMLRDLTRLQEGADYMLDCSCKPGGADNHLASHRYFVRCEKQDAPLFHQTETRFITEKMAVADMHEKAKQIRALNRQIFFAGIEE